MARPSPETDLKAIEAVVRSQPGSTSTEIAAALPAGVKRRTLQYRLKRLVDDGRLVRDGDDRWSRYRVPDALASPAHPDSMADEAAVPLSPESRSIKAQVRQPLTARTPVGYNREFLSAYRPGETFYLPVAARARLADTGARPMRGQEPAGTYARQILSRLLIDLSWNSSRLEGNTYSLLDTKRLIEFGQEAKGGDRRDAQMILNHKDAVEFLVGNAAEIGFNRYTILNLHGILANNLLADDRAAGRLRHISVGIDGSVYHPPETPQLVEECFDQLLATADAITDPFEQSLFVMVQLPYLQPFDDVNKRVSRMAANIPLIKANLSPLSFTDLPSGLYTHAMLGVYELNRIELLRDVFMWSYERSAARYAAVRQSLGEPDPFRLRYRDALRTVVSEVVRGRLDRRAAAAHVEAWTVAHIDAGDRTAFRDAAETELLSLHEGNFARYAVRPGEFAAWQEVWVPRHS
jgi:hypothetical protein